MQRIEAFNCGPLALATHPRDGHTELTHQPSAAHRAISSAELTGLSLFSGHVCKIHGVLLGIFGLTSATGTRRFNPATGMNLPRALERRRLADTVAIHHD